MQVEVRAPDLPPEAVEQMRRRIADLERFTDDPPEGVRLTAARRRRRRTGAGRALRRRAARPHRFVHARTNEDGVVYWRDDGRIGLLFPPGSIDAADGRGRVYLRFDGDYGLVEPV
jgi:hypothetical protein